MWIKWPDTGMNNLILCSVNKTSQRQEHSRAITLKSDHTTLPVLVIISLKSEFSFAYFSKITSFLREYICATKNYTKADYVIVKKLR